MDRRRVPPHAIVWNPIYVYRPPLPFVCIGMPHRAQFSIENIEPPSLLPRAEDQRAIIACHRAHLAKFCSSRYS